MNESLFKLLMLGVALAFSLIFFLVVVPPLIDNPDIMGAFMAGFVNPFASGYSFDVILCWCALAIWITYESKAYAIRHGWICLLLGLVPGVAVGFSLYLLLRHEQLKRLNRTV